MIFSFVIPYFSWTQFHLGPLTINVWGLMVMIGILAAFGIAVSEAKRRASDAAIIMEAAFWIVLGGIIGARLFFVANEPQFFTGRWVEALYFWQGGLAWMGGIIGATLGAWFFSWRKRISLLTLTDVIAFALPAGIFFGRLGCFFIHDHLGKITTCPNCGAQVTEAAEWRFDGGLYLSLNAALLFLLFLLFRRRNPRRFEGFYLSFYLLWDGIVRFLLDFLRTTRLDSPLTGDPHWWIFTPTQYASVLLAGLGVAGLWRLSSWSCSESKKMI